jgi:cytochrome d ubiquinol oxidase subunit II
MSLAEVVLTLMWCGVTLYAVFGGADFGAGFWDLVAGGTRRGAAQRALIERAIGPVWEANHVWLVFVLVVLWTGFPRAFAPIMATLYVPLTAAAVGVILRGSAFAFRKSVVEVELKRVFGAAFAMSSLLTPFFLGTVAGAVASGRVPERATGAGDPLAPWINPTSMLGGALAVSVCAVVAATFLAVEAGRSGDAPLVAAFRLRAVLASVVTGALALGGIAVLAADAPELFDGLTGSALPLVIGAGVTGLASLWCLVTRRFRAARVLVVAAVVAIIWGWAVGQHPTMLEPDLTIAEAAGSRSSLTALLACLVVGGVLFAPPMAWLLIAANRGDLAPIDVSASEVSAADVRGSEGRSPR